MSLGFNKLFGWVKRGAGGLLPPLTNSILAWYNSNLGDQLVDKIDPLKVDPEVGVIDRAVLQFDGVGNYVESLAAIPSDYPFTMSGWFKTDTVNTLGYLTCLGSEVGNRFCAVYLTATGQLAIVASGGSGQKIVVSTGSYKDNNWHYFEGRFAASDDRRCFIGDSPETVVEVAVDTIDVPFSEMVSDRFLLGIRYAGSYDWPHTGFLADVGLAEGSNILGRYALEETSGLTAYDTSGNGNHGTITTPALQVMRIGTRETDSDSHFHETASTIEDLDSFEIGMYVDTEITSSTSLHTIFAVPTDSLSPFISLGAVLSTPINETLMIGTGANGDFIRDTISIGYHLFRFEWSIGGLEDQTSGLPTDGYLISVDGVEKTTYSANSISKLPAHQFYLGRRSSTGTFYPNKYFHFAINDVILLDGWRLDSSFTDVGTEIHPSTADGVYSANLDNGFGKYEQDDGYEISGWATAGNVTRIAGQTDPDGGTSAYAIRYDGDEVNGRIYQPQSTVKKFSCYLNNGTMTSDRVVLQPTGTRNLVCIFNLSMGTVDTEATGCSASMESVGGGWYKCVVESDTIDLAQYVIVQAEPSDGTATGDLLIYDPHTWAGSTHYNAPALSDGSGTDVFGNELTNIGGTVSNGFEGGFKFPDTSIELLNSVDITIDGDVFTLPQTGIQNDKPIFYSTDVGAYGAYLKVSYGTYWSIADFNPSPSDHLTADGLFPPKDNWPLLGTHTISLDYSSFAIDDSDDDDIQFKRFNHQDLLDWVNLNGDTLIKWEKTGTSNICTVTELIFYLQNTVEGFTLGDYNKAVNYRGDADCGAGIIEPLYDVDENIIYDTDGQIVFVQPS